MPPRPLLIDAGRQLVLWGGGLAGAALALVPAAKLGWRGVAVALALYGVIAGLVLLGLVHHLPHRRFGLANGVTLVRAAAAALFLGIVGEGAALGEPLRWGLAIAGTAALLLDGVDGWVARRSGLASAFGARFDMEVDALFVLALSALVYTAGQTGAWVLTSGLIRYTFILAGWLYPPLTAPIPPSWRRKAVCVVQVAVLVAALAPAVAPEAARWLCLAGLVLLGYSFGTDCLWLVSAGRRGGAREALDGAALEQPALE